MNGMLIAYDDEGNVIATLDTLVVRDESGAAVGLADFAAHEAQGGRFRFGPDRPDGIWDVPGAIGSGVWPEWLGSHVQAFKVERDGSRIVRLVHRESGHARDRAKIEKAIGARIKAARDEPADIRDLVGGPDRPLRLDPRGRTAGPVPTHSPAVPVIRPSGSEDEDESGS